MTVCIDDLVLLGETPVEIERFAPEPARVLHGRPEQSARNDYGGAGGRLNVGEWCCEPGAWRVAYDDDEYEFCHLLEGRVRLSDEAGRSREFRVGDSFVIPAGFRGIWETLASCRKRYVICRIAPAAQ